MSRVPGHSTACQCSGCEKGTCEKRDLMAENERLRTAYDKLCKDTPNFRAAIVEECARVAETWNGIHYGRQRELDIASAIRALKDKPCP